MRKIDQERYTGSRGTILNKIVMKRFSEKLIFEERPERNDGMSHVAILEKSIPGKANEQALRQENV